VPDTSAQHPTEYVIHIDSKQFKVTKSAMSGAELKVLAGKESTYQLFLEQGGHDPDKLIGDNDSVQMRNGLHFYTVPPATFGERWIC
jgi:hypothetical protein